MDKNENVTKQYFFLCPECLTLQSRWHETFRCVEDATRVIEMDTGESYIEDTDHDGYDYISSYCEECEKEFPQISSAFVIAIDLRNLEIIPYGEYWIKNRVLLEKYRNKILDQFLRKIDPDIINI